MFGYLYEFVMQDCTVLKCDNTLSEILGLFNMAYIAIIQGYGSDDRSTIDYLDNFRSSLIECLTGMISSIQISNNIFNNDDYN